MKKHFLLLVLTVITYHAGKCQEKADALVWKKNVLTWEYFKEVESIGSGHALARIYWKLHVLTDDTASILNGQRGFKAKVYALMIPSLSLVQTNANRRGVLEHEQMHFDIVEVAARELRKLLIESGLEEKNFNRKMQAKVRKLLSQLNKTQDKYDEQHRGKVNGHNAWREKIDLQLASLESYSNVSIFVPFVKE